MVIPPCFLSVSHFVVKSLLDAGTTVVGKTHLDELAYSLNGENVHFGTPVNVAASGRIPGGSSSGSAVSGSLLHGPAVKYMLYHQNLHNKSQTV
jgi:hypothetical protein